MKDQNRVRNSIENVSFSSHEPNMQPQNATELIGRIDNVFYLKMTDTDTSSRPWFPSKSFFLREHASDVHLSKKKPPRAKNEFLHHGNRCLFCHLIPSISASVSRKSFNFWIEHFLTHLIFRRFQR